MPYKLRTSIPIIDASVRRFDLEYFLIELEALGYYLIADFNPPLIHRCMDSAFSHFHQRDYFY